MYARLAVRNLSRNPLRTAITLLAIAVGSASLIIVQGFLEDSVARMREGFIANFLGHLQVTRSGFREHGLADPYKYMIEDPSGLLARLKNVPAVSFAAPKIHFSGLLSNGDRAMVVTGEGVDPDSQSRMHKVRDWVSGTPLESQEDYVAVLGAGLAASLHLTAGQSATLVTNTAQGAVNAIDLRIKGVFRTTSKAYDDRTLRLPLRTVQELLQTSGVQSIAIVIPQTRDTDAVAQSLETLFRENGLSLEVRRWHQLAEGQFVTKTAAFFRRLMTVLEAIIVSVGILSVLNTMSMSVLERVGEIGTLRALGTPRRAIASLFLFEGAALGLLGGVAGWILGGAISAAISAVGITIPGGPGTEGPFIARVMFVPEIYLVSFVLACLTALASSVAPAVKASRLEMAEALRHNV